MKMFPDKDHSIESDEPQLGMERLVPASKRSGREKEREKRPSGPKTV